MDKIMRTYRLSAPNVEYISTVSAQRRISQTAALEQIIDEHRRLANSEANRAAAEYIADAVADKLDKILTRIRLAANNADRNSDVLVELMNGIYNYEGYMGLATTEEVLHPGIEKAKKAVRDRIKAYQTAKNAREKNAKAAEVNENDG